MLISSFHEYCQRHVVLVVELHILIDTEISKAFPFSIAPRFLAFIRVISVNGAWTTIFIAVVVILLKTVVESLASLNFRKGSLAVDVVKFAPVKCMDGFSGRWVWLWKLWIVGKCLACWPGDAIWIRWWPRCSGVYDLLEIDACIEQNKGDLHTFKAIRFEFPTAPTVGSSCEWPKPAQDLWTL